MKISYFVVKNWEESFSIQKNVAHAKAKYSITGDLNGEIDVDYSIFYLYYDSEEIHNSSSKFTGFAVFNGEIEDKKGTFVMEDCGEFINKNYKASVKILNGSGTGDFINISGYGSYKPKGDGMELHLTIE